MTTAMMTTYSGIHAANTQYSHCHVHTAIGRGRGGGGFISTFRREHGMGGDGAGVGVKCSKHGQVCRVMGRFLVAREVFRCLESIQ